MLSICLFHSLSPSVVFFMPYLSLPKCQEQKGRKKRNYRTDYSWGLLIKQVMQILRIYGAIRLFFRWQLFCRIIYFFRREAWKDQFVWLFFSVSVKEWVIGSELTLSELFLSRHTYLHNPHTDTHTSAFLELLPSDKANLSLTQIKRPNTVDRRVAVGDRRLLLLRTADWVIVRVQFTSSKKRRKGCSM